MPQSVPPTTHPASTRMVTVGGRHLRIDVRPGDGSTTPLLVFGGIGASLDVLQPLVDGLDPAVEVIRVDVPGVGGSPAGLFPYNFAQLAATMVGLLDRLGHRRVDVLGYSWGGALAQQLVLQSADRCRRLVLVSANTGFLSIPGDARVLNQMLSPRYLEHPADAAALDDELKGRAMPGTSRSAEVALWSPTAAGYLHQLAALSSWTSLPFLPLISRPTLVLNGDDDPIVPAANARILAAAIPDATLQIFQGGHLEIVTAAADLANRVNEFLKS